jgi:arabinofuranosyltransferase
VWLLVCVVAPGAIAALLYEQQAWRLAHAHGFPLDDAWIHAQFARNLATGHGFSYTGDRWVAGSTAPLWTLLWALVQLLVPNVVWGAKALGLVLQGVSAILGARILLHLTQDRLAALAAGLAVGLAPVLVWGAVSGMEVPLASALVLAAIDRHLRDRTDPSWRAARGVALAALACLARPECAIVVALLLWGLIPRAANRLTGFLAALGAIAIVWGAWVGFNEWTTGLPLPTTFYVKSGPGVIRALQSGDREMAVRALTVHGPNAIVQFGEILRDQLGLAAWLVPIGLGCGLLRRSTRGATWLLLAILIVAPYFMGITAPQRLKPDNVRYAPHLVALAGLALGLLLAAARVLRPLPQTLTPTVRTAIAGVLLAAIAISVSARAAAGAPFYARSVKNIEELHVALGRWLHVNLPPGTTVATNDIGAIAFFGEHPVLDIEGLVSPEALAHRGLGRGLKVVEAGRPDYIAFFPHWYPEIAADARFPEICRASIRDNYVSGGDTFLIVRTPWTRSAWPAVLRPGEPCR